MSRVLLATVCACYLSSCHYALLKRLSLTFLSNLPWGSGKLVGSSQSSPGQTHPISLAILVVLDGNHPIFPARYHLTARLAEQLISRKLVGESYGILLQELWEATRQVCQDFGCNPLTSFDLTLCKNISWTFPLTAASAVAANSSSIGTSQCELLRCPLLDLTMLVEKNTTQPSSGCCRLLPSRICQQNCKPAFS